MFSEDWVLHDTENRAFRRGRSEGRAEGEAIGETRGKAEGLAQYDTLVIKLFETGRGSELELAARDSAKLHSLYAEFGIA